MKAIIEIMAIQIDTVFEAERAAVKSVFLLPYVHLASEIEIAFLYVNRSLDATNYFETNFLVYKRFIP